MHLNVVESICCVEPCKDHLNHASMSPSALPRFPRFFCSSEILGLLGQPIALQAISYSRLSAADRSFFLLSATKAKVEFLVGEGRPFKRALRRKKAHRRKYKKKPLLQITSSFSEGKTNIELADSLFGIKSTVTIKIIKIAIKNKSREACFRPLSYVHESSKEIYKVDTTIFICQN